MRLYAIFDDKEKNIKKCIYCGKHCSLNIIIYYKLIDYFSLLGNNPMMHVFENIGICDDHLLDNENYSNITLRYMSRLLRRFQHENKNVIVNEKTKLILTKNFNMINST